MNLPSQLNENLHLIMTAKRILILGSPASGKSTIAAKLATITGKRLFSIDDLYWKPGWQRPEDDSWLTNLHGILENEQWIVEGNYAQYLEQRLRYADLIIYMDIKPWVCLYRYCKRAVDRYMSWNTRKMSINIKFMLKILTFSQRIRPQMISLIEEYKVQMLVVAKANNHKRNVDECYS